MKKLFLFCLLFGSIINFSCENSFSSKTDFKQQYVLYCILDGDTTFQFAQIYKTFNVKGYDPGAYSGNLSVSGASVKIAYNDSIFVLQEISDTSSGAANGEHLYYATNLKPLPNKILNIEADLGDSVHLFASTKTPRSNTLSFNVNEVQSDFTIYDNPSGAKLVWQILDVKNFPILYLPKLTIYYYKDTGKKKLYDSKEIPLSYFNSGNERKANYPIIISNTELNYPMEAINETFANISVGDSDKNSYYIVNAEFELFILDNSLAPYYLSLQTFLDGYTVLLDQTDYSNVSGGYGVFGSFYKKIHKMSVDPDYALKFGYRLAHD